MKRHRAVPILSAALLVLCAAAGPAPAAGQEEGTLSLVAEAGLGLPVGDLGDVSDPGPAFRFGAEYALSPAAGLLGSVQAEVFSAVTAAGGQGPTVRLFRFLVGPTYAVVRPDARRGFRLSVHAGVGGTAFSAGRTFVGSGSDVRIIDLNSFYFGLGGGLSAGYELSPTVGAYLSVDGSLSFADEADTEVFGFLVPGLEPFSSLVSVPLTAGVRLSFPR